MAPLTIRPGVEIPDAELRWRFSRSSGPGGQGVNTADSRVELSWDLEASSVLGPTLKHRARERLGNRLVDGVITIAASEHRAQLRNREAALERLAALVGRAIAAATAATAGDEAVAGSERTADRRQETPRRGQAAPASGQRD